MKHIAHRRAWYVFLFPMILLAAYRAWFIAASGLPLYVDEAQYWTWSLAPDWGYYSKPPMVAWIIRAFGFLGESELAVRAGTLLLHPLTAVLCFVLARRLFGTTAALMAGLLFISLPLVGFNSLFMTTDAPLFFFWGLASYALWRALNGNAWRDWALVGAAAGLGLLSKYSMAVFAVSVACVLCLPAFRAHWRNPRLYAAAALAFAVFLPNLLWNMRTDFVSFRHTVEISQLDRGLFHPSHLAEFIGGQFACMGPIAFSFLLAALASVPVWRDRRYGFLAALTLPFLAVIALQALLAKANANWAAPAYFAGTVLVAGRLAERPRIGWWIAMVVLNLILLSGFYHYRALASAAGVELTRKTDPYSRVLGWPQAGAEVGKVLSRYPDTQLAVLDRSEFALLSYYVRPHPRMIRIWNPEGNRQNHFHLFADIGRETGADFLFATTHELSEATAEAFERWTPLGTVTVPLYRDDQLRLHLYRGVHFKGYAQ